MLFSYVCITVIRMKQSNETTEALLDAATRLFAARGFDGASIREITSEAQ